VAHEFLHSTPTAANVFADGPRMILPYSHQGFAVIIVGIYINRVR
jgi:hypothetical protein